MKTVFYKFFTEDFSAQQVLVQFWWVYTSQSNINSPLGIFYRRCDQWQDEVFRYKCESVGLVNSVVLNFPCFKETVILRKWTSLVER